MELETIQIIIAKQLAPLWITPKSLSGKDHFQVG